MQFLSILFFCLITISLDSQEVIKENIGKAHTGDWLVISFDKNFSLYRVLNNVGHEVHLEEASISPVAFRRLGISWKEWAFQGYPLARCKMTYRIDLSKGQVQMQDSSPHASTFLSTLINLHFKKIPDIEKKRVGLPLFDSGPTDTRPVWQPKLVFNGQEIKNAQFDAFKARWPNDQSDLSGKFIEIYLPKEGQLYPSYFPYFMQVSGMIGKAKMHIIDSGRF